MTLPHLRRDRKAGKQFLEKSGFRHSAGTDTAGANSHALVGFSLKYSNTLKVRIPAPLRQIMGVANLVPIYRAFVTDFAARHEGKSPLI